LPQELAADAIHVVDDDEALRGLIAREMRAQGFHVIESADGSDALRVAESYRGRIRLLITDVVLPGVSGVALAETIASVRSDLRVLFISGFTDERVSRAGKGFSASAFLRKPFDLETLNKSVRELLEEDLAVVVS
jgi:DNA-binding response OmpR family regulator